MGKTGNIVKYYLPEMYDEVQKNVTIFIIKLNKLT